MSNPISGIPSHRPTPMSEVFGLVQSVIDEPDSGVIVGVTDAAGRITYANRAFCAISGYTVEELIGQDHRLLNSGHHARTFWSDMYREVHAGRTWRAEVCNRAKDGTRYWVDTTVRGVFDATGALVSIVSVRVDATARKRAESLATDSTRRLEAMVAGSRAGLWEATLRPEESLSDSTPCQLSGRLIEFLGGAMCGRVVMPRLGSLLERIHEDDRAGVLAALNEHLATRRAFERRFRMLNSKGECRHVEARTQAVWDMAGRPLSVAGSIDDVTEWIEAQEALRQSLHDLIQTRDAMAARQRELIESTQKLEAARAEAEAANRAKSDFLARVSHEFRTPLNAVLGFTELVDDEASRVDALATIRCNAEHLLSLINDILDLSKIEAGKLKAASEPTDAISEIRHAVELHSQRAQAKGISLSCEVVNAPPGQIQSDPMRLRQILINLVGNAIKFTERGEVRVCVEYRADNRLSVHVRDTGIGIDPRHLVSLFEPFQQVDSSMSRRSSGTGLGLSISKHLAEMLGGNITVQSEPGQGSVFALTISALPAKAIEREVQVGPPPAHVTPLEGLRVLLAEDGEDNQRLFCCFLKRAGAVVTLANNGQEAIERAQQALAEGSPPQVLLMDMQMPILDGYEATSRLRAAGYSLPIVALTAHATLTDRQRCLDAGCDDFATKPISARDLIALCRRIAEQNTGDDRPLAA
ncbi:MAG: PAS domain S-box protein [Phycisphaerales bacterium]|nr:PAS domain S-box protein [Phycisphaerales bacterium]